jgi:hypothetical protein
MTSQVTKKSSRAITVFYPANSLMHQVSDWAVKYPTCNLTLSFAQSLNEIRSVLRRTWVAIADATEDPARAMTAFAQAIAALQVECVAVYTETMHEGLELFVRVRGAPLLLGPLSDLTWQQQLEKMLQAAERIHAGGSPARRSQITDGAAPQPWIQKHRLQTSLTTRLHKFFPERR